MNIDIMRTVRTAGTATTGVAAAVGLGLLAAGAAAPLGVAVVAVGAGVLIGGGYGIVRSNITQHWEKQRESKNLTPNLGNDVKQYHPSSSIIRDLNPWVGDPANPTASNPVIRDIQGKNGKKYTAKTYIEETEATEDKEGTRTKVTITEEVNSSKRMIYSQEIDNDGKPTGALMLGSKKNPSQSVAKRSTPSVKSAPVATKQKNPKTPVTVATKQKNPKTPVTVATKHKNPKTPVTVAIKQKNPKTPVTVAKVPHSTTTTVAT